ncbi:extensin family protein [Chenggangzhangella methanolivorans]|uniref:Extensin family protein n=2 Tax=Chenggangzhangella methanolivorans TaxID=1437009 RepID=A0A9E6R9X4_9HYPH|nr:extensin family protein [Chenggangzhangella methanolivorans]QZO00252.1 extensin family protein [Chenggangzhangella methanolivorans]
MALLSSLQKPAPVAAPQADEDEDETPDMHVPLPPVRPGGETAAASPPPNRERLAPEGGLAPDGQGLAPDSVPIPSPRDERSAALNPEVPLPPEAPEPPKGPTPPAIELPVTSHAEDPACAALADESFAVAEQIPPIEGPGVCGGGPLVRLTGVKRKDGGLILIKPAATLRCGMAKELAEYLREDVSPSAEAAGTKLEKLEIAGSFQCRGRNGAAGGKMSEHGRANAVDLSGFGFADGKEFGIFAAELPEPVKTAAKAGACARFATVLGPGSDGFHETHLHIDLQPRRSKAKLCQWSDPEVAKAKDEDSQEAEAPKPASAKDGEPEKADAGKGEAKGASSNAQASGRKADRPDEPLPKRSETP